MLQSYKEGIFVLNNRRKTPTKDFRINHSSKLDHTLTELESSIEKLQKEGFIFVWKFTDNTKNYPGWNICFDNLAWNFLNVLLKLMGSSPWSSKKSCIIDRPTERTLAAINNMQGKAGWLSPKELIIKYVNDPSASDQWNMTFYHRTLTISIGRRKLIELQDAILKTKGGMGDFAVSGRNEENILYFWPLVT